MAVEQLTSYNDDGANMGQDASDKIAFHGSTPVAQQTVADTTTTTKTAAAVATDLDDLRTALVTLGLVTL